MMKKRSRKKAVREEAAKQTQKIKETATLTGVLMHRENHVELTGNHEAMVDGCKGIVEYSENTIRVNIEQGQLKFVGRDLQIVCMTEDSMVIRGFIMGLEYCN